MAWHGFTFWVVAWKPLVTILSRSRINNGYFDATNFCWVSVQQDVSTVGKKLEFEQSCQILKWGIKDVISYHHGSMITEKVSFSKDISCTEVKKNVKTLWYWRSDEFSFWNLLVWIKCAKIKSISWIRSKNTM